MHEDRSPVVEIIYFTDPYCTWCWGSEPILRHLETSLGDQLRISYKMGGLVEDMENFFDPSNKISNIQQVAPHWQEASERHGMPVDIAVFSDISEDFKSTWPACVAFKAAEMQDTEKAARYLRRLREAAASERRAIHRTEVQVELAEEVGLDAERFKADLESKRAREAFLSDLHEGRRQGIGAFPSFIVKNREEVSVHIHGYHSYMDFLHTVERLSTQPLVISEPDDIPGFVSDYGHVATQEVAEAFGLTTGEALERLGGLVASGVIQKIPLGTGEFWEPVI